jgi:hypothetical protein
MTDQYESLYSHLIHHNPRQWSLRGAEEEDARTIKEAIEQLDDMTFCRRFARMLAKGPSKEKR